MICLVQLIENSNLSQLLITVEEKEETCFEE